MASLMENLIEVLDSESREYENLLELSTQKNAGDYIRQSGRISQNHG